MPSDKEWITITSCSSRIRPTGESSATAYRGFTLYYTVSGISTLIMQGRSGMEYQLKPSSFALINSAIPHRLMVAGHTSCHMIQFVFEKKPSVGMYSLEWLEQICPGSAELFNTEKEIHIGKENSGLLLTQLASLVQCVHHSRLHPMNENMVPLHLAAVLIWITHLVNKKVAHRSAAPVYVNRAVHFIELHYFSPFSLEEVARQAGCNPSYLERVFKQALGRTIMEYTISLRIKNACHMLINTEFSIIDIAYECGFSTRQHFMRCFRKLMGTTPLKYRKENQRNIINTAYLNAARTDEEK